MIPARAFSIRPTVPVYCRRALDGADALLRVAGLIDGQHRVVVTRARPERDKQLEG
jgi:hypothetical protein